MSSRAKRGIGCFCEIQTKSSFRFETRGASGAWIYKHGHGSSNGPLARLFQPLDWDETGHASHSNNSLASGVRSSGDSCPTRFRASAPRARAIRTHTRFSQRHHGGGRFLSAGHGNNHRCQHRACKFATACFANFRPLTEIRNGNRYVVGFEALSATRDSANEPFRVEDYSNGKRIYFGSANVMLPAGRHVYTFSYTTNRQLGFFADHDELFWNVTGLGWPFPIDHASATVHLPSAIPTDKVHFQDSPGPARVRAKSQLTTSTEGGAFVFATTKPLRSVRASALWFRGPRDLWTPPSFAQKVGVFLSR